MVRSLPRRKRGLLVTISIGGLTIVLAAVAFILLRPAKETYLPGGEIEGLRTTQDRSTLNEAPRIRFNEVTYEAGIGFVHFSGRRSSQLPEDMGSGAAWGDYNDDGWLDLYVVNIVGPLTMTDEEISASPARNALYRNNGDGTFEEVGVEAGVDLRHFGSGAGWGDYDHDGDVDLFVTSYGENVLFRNDGDGSFTDVTAASGVGGVRGFWAGASWADYDRDGNLDLYVTGYVRYDPSVWRNRPSQYDIENPASISALMFNPERNLLYRNNGDGTFEEVAAAAGVDNPTGRSLGGDWEDFDDDGWPDLYVANQFSDHVLYRNLGDGTFEDVSRQLLVADNRSTAGLAVGDWDNALTQMSLDFAGWGTASFDYDNDGNRDILLINGSTSQSRDNPDFLIGMQDLLFRNDGPDRGFVDVSARAGEYFLDALVGRGAAFADYDRDGDVDVFIVNHGMPGVLLRNDGHPTNHWLELALVGTDSNLQGIGARVRVTAGGRTYLEEVGAQPSYLSQNSPVVHFGLGSASRVDSLEIRWPLGRISILTDLAVDQIHTLVEGSIDDD